MILSTLVISQLHFEMCAGPYGHPVYVCCVNCFQFGSHLGILVVMVVALFM